MGPAFDQSTLHNLADMHPQDATTGQHAGRCRAV